jgi:hypothetical protein
MRHTVMLFLLILLAGFGQGRAAGVPKSAGPIEAGIELANSEQGLESGQIVTEFDVFGTRDLWVRVRVPKIDSPTLLNLTFTTPRGDVYYETNSYFSRLPRVTTRRPTGADHPVTVFQARRLPGGYGLDLSIPITGSVFQRYPIPGIWTVRARLSGSNETLSTTVSVRVTP